MLFSYLIPNLIYIMDIDTITNKSLEALQVRTVADESAVVLPEGYCLKQLLSVRMTPPRKMGHFRLHRLEDLIAFVKREDEESCVRSLVYVNEGEVLAVCNHYDEYNEAAAGGWMDRRVSFDLVKSMEWNTWMRFSGRSISQAEFVDFIEDNYKDIVAVEGSPSASDMLTLASKFDMNRKVEFKQAYRSVDGETKLTYNETLEAKSGDILLPNDFMIQIPVIKGAEEETLFNIKARLKVRLKDGELSFSFTLVRPDLCLESSLDAIGQKVKEGLPDNNVYRGGLECDPMEQTKALL